MNEKRERESAWAAISKISKLSAASFPWFTLAELVVVIAILAILSAIGFLALQDYSSDAKDAAVRANVRSVMTAISSESAATGNSPRYYVVHDPAAALTGAVAFVDGSPVVLTGGQHGTDGTNYSAGNPDWAKLKLNPDKFPVAGMGALDAALTPTVSGRSRSTSFFQVAAIHPSTGAASVAGTFVRPTEAEISSGAVTGLVKSPHGTGALEDGGSAGTSGLYWGSSSSSSGGWASQFPGCNAPDIVIPKVGLVWAACNVGATTAYAWQTLPSCPYSEDVDCFSSVRHILGDYYQWGRNSPITGTWIVWESHAPWSQPTHNDFIISNEATWQDWLSSPDGNRWGWEGTTTAEWTYADMWNSAMRGPCPVGYHVPTAREWSLTAAALDDQPENDPDEHWYVATKADPGAWTTPEVAMKLRIPAVWWMVVAYPGSPKLYADGDIAWLWSSTPYGDTAAWIQWTESYQGGLPGDRARHYWKNVRCVRNAVNTVIPECGDAVDWSPWGRKPDYALCRSGLPSEVTGVSGSWTWSCKSSLDPLHTTGQVVCNAE